MGCSSSKELPVLDERHSSLRRSSPKETYRTVALKNDDVTPKSSTFVQTGSELKHEPDLPVVASSDIRKLPSAPYVPDEGVVGKDDIPTKPSVLHRVLTGELESSEAQNVQIERETNFDEGGESKDEITAWEVDDVDPIVAGVDDIHEQEELVLVEKSVDLGSRVRVTTPRVGKKSPGGVMFGSEGSTYAADDAFLASQRKVSKVVDIDKGGSKQNAGGSHNTTIETRSTPRFTPFRLSSLGSINVDKPGCFDADTSENEYGARLIRFGIGTRSSVNEVALFPSSSSSNEDDRVYELLLEYSDGYRDGVRIKFHNPCEFYCFEYIPLNTYEGNWVEVGERDFIRTITITYSLRYTPCLFDGVKVVMASGKYYDYGQACRHSNINGDTNDNLFELHQINLPNGPYRLHGSIMDNVPDLGIAVVTRDAGVRLSDNVYEGQYDNVLRLMILEVCYSVPGVSFRKRRKRPWDEILRYLELMEKCGQKSRLKREILGNYDENCSVFDFVKGTDAPKSVIEIISNLLHS